MQKTNSKNRRAEGFLKAGALLAVVLCYFGAVLAVFLAHVAKSFMSIAPGYVTDVKTVSSPDGQYQAFTFTRGIDGANHSSEASILKSNTPLIQIDTYDAVGNIFAISAENVFLDIRWLDNRTLLIRYKTDGEIVPSLKVIQLGDVSIEYQEEIE